MRRAVVLVLLLGTGILCLACGGGAPKPSTPVSKKVDTHDDAYPSEDEVRAFLEGKSATLNDPSDRKKTGPTITLSKDNIEALEVDKRADLSETPPWKASLVKLVVKTEKGKFFVEVVVLHQKVGEKRVFKESFTIQKVDKAN
jgi:hypothetical protein